MPLAVLLHKSLQQIFEAWPQGLGIAGNRIFAGQDHEIKGRQQRVTEPEGFTQLPPQRVALDCRPDVLLADDETNPCQP